MGIIILFLLLLCMFEIFQNKKVFKKCNGFDISHQESEARESNGRSARPRDGEQDRTPHCTPAWSPLRPTPCPPIPCLRCLQIPKLRAPHSEPRDHCGLPTGPAGAQQWPAPGPGPEPRGHERLTPQNTLDSWLPRSEASIQVFINKTTSFSDNRRDPGTGFKGCGRGDSSDTTTPSFWA